MTQQEQEPQSPRKGPPAKHRSRLRGWLAQVWRGTKENAALVSLVGVLLTLLVTTMLAQQEQVRQQKLENQRAEAERELVDQQAQRESLQTYLGDMGELILRDTSPLRTAEPGSEVSTLARAKTLTVLAGLDAQSKSILLQFLIEAELVQSVEGGGPVITLSDADLSDAKLLAADLFAADLSSANLFASDLSSADLGGADLGSAILRGADLRGADLRGADLEGAQGVTKDQLEQPGANLEGATMPDGSKHP